MRCPGEAHVLQYTCTIFVSAIIVPFVFITCRRMVGYEDLKSV